MKSLKKIGKDALTKIFPAGYTFYRTRIVEFPETFMDLGKDREYYSNLARNLFFKKFPWHPTDKMLEIVFEVWGIELGMEYIDKRFPFKWENLDIVISKIKRVEEFSFQPTYLIIRMRADKTIADKYEYVLCYYLRKDT